MRKVLIAILVGICAICMVLAVGCARPAEQNQNVLSVTIDGEQTFVWKGQKAALPEPQNSDANKIFVEWQTSDGQTFDPGTALENDLVIVSVWRDKYIYSLTFDGVAYEVKEGDVLKPPVPEGREGFDFVGWFNGNKPYDESEAIVSDCAYVSRWVTKENRKDISVMPFVSIGALGGTNTAAWDSYAARDDEGIAFRFNAVADAVADDGVGIFLNVGERTGTARNGATFLIRISVAGKIEISNYPNNSKQSLISGEWGLENGIFTQTRTDSGKTIIETYIPYLFFEGVDESYAIESQDVIALTLTGEDFSTAKWDVFMREDMTGADGEAEVDRMNLADYLRFSYGGVLYEYDKNDADVFIAGNAGQEGVLVSCEGKTVLSDSEGKWTLALLSGGKSSLELTFEKAAYVSQTQRITLDPAEINYTASDIELAGVIASVKGIVKDYVSGLAVAGANVQSAYGTVSTGADGAFELENVDLSKTLSLTIAAEDYGEINVEFTSEQLIGQDFSAEIRLVSNQTVFTVEGNIKDIFGSLEDVTVSDGNGSVQTLADGSFALGVSYGDVALTFEKAGYVGYELVVKADELLAGENYICSLGEIEMQRTPVSLGSLGGTNVEYVWNGTATRDSNGLYFEYVTENDVPESDTIGVGTFLNMDYIRYSGYRTANTYLIGIYTSGKITVYNYPGTSKRAATLEGLSLEVLNKENSVTLKLFIPYSALTAKGIAVNARSDFGISLTADYSSSTWDVWMRADLLGFDGMEEVDRENSLDYLVWKADNTLSEYDVTMDRERFESLAESLGAVEEEKSIFENIAAVSTDATTTIEAIEENRLVFTDRTNFKFSTMIDAVAGMDFTYSTIAKGPQITVEQDGYLILILPATGSYKPIRTAAEEDGWTMVLQGYHITGTLTDKLNYYVKWCKAGEVFEYGKWNFFIV